MRTPKERNVRPSTAYQFAILAATGLALLMPHSRAQAQSLFNNRASSGSSQTSATSASLFSRIGVPQLPGVGGVPSASGSFVGRSNRGFIGSRLASQSSSSGGESGYSERGSTGSRSASGARGDGLQSERASTSSAADGQREASGDGRRTPILFRQRIAFDFPARQPNAITGRLTKQLANLAERYPDLAQIEVLAEPNGVVRLQGRVPSDETRKLAAILVGLEPGVRGVQNELAVAGDPD